MGEGWGGGGVVLVQVGELEGSLQGAFQREASRHLLGPLQPPRLQTILEQLQQAPAPIFPGSSSM